MVKIDCVREGVKKRYSEIERESKREREKGNGRDAIL